MSQNISDITVGELARLLSKFPPATKLSDIKNIKIERNRLTFGQIQDLLDDELNDD